tara:strand:+ start:1797 stop:1955 length:159 start_codon:yes stop_codon:yes gene_type:complete
MLPDLGPVSIVAIIPPAAILHARWLVALIALASPIFKRSVARTLGAIGGYGS